MDCIECLCAAHLLTCANLSFQPATNDLLAHVLNTTHEQLLQVVLFHRLYRLVGPLLGNLSLMLLKIDLQVPDLVCVVGLEDLDIALGLLLDLRLCHAGGEEDVKELAELEVFSRNRALSVPASHVSARADCIRVGTVVLGGKESVLVGVARADALEAGCHE